MNSDPCPGSLRMRGFLTAGAEVILELQRRDWLVLSELGIRREGSKRKHEGFQWT